MIVVWPVARNSADGWVAGTLTCACVWVYLSLGLGGWYVRGCIKCVGGVGAKVQEAHTTGRESVQQVLP